MKSCSVDSPILPDSSDAGGRADISTTIMSRKPIDGCRIYFIGRRHLISVDPGAETPI